MDAIALAKANEPVPDMVKQFVVYFYRHIREKNGACPVCVPCRGVRRGVRRAVDPAPTRVPAPRSLYF